uniref:non-specific serine/threonine protein kinase n=1 Tax=Chromera velia CCMP2878 TaxID=1169474 RepID=A0A0G4HFN9_9ALVE|eukprot:Cvel_27116.t1-p1 / transcript=Cvel_27116.t1 / gene=Cvel_27116 / organism=Chromera_velia_CCMP2878 / gene_product=Probable serine/threonine-protein kinase pdkA, putative / transcript_product=Probable serine/threonine-protein kinase pdkA, putative / location=Cvel_scaffold3328:2376-3753(-) / protein_length=429 / sequence_SO=supercontig / SO=protein_coding / is_pseudo=false
MTMQGQRRRPCRGDFEFGSLLGRGALGKVFHVRDVSTHEEYALKILEKKQILEAGKGECVMRERKILSELRHPNVIRLHATFQDDKFLYFLLEPALRGDLGDHIKRYGYIPLEAARFYAAELVSALHQLQSKKVLHRDLKPENILIANDGHLRLIDFECATLVETRSAGAPDGCLPVCAQEPSPSGGQPPDTEDNSALDSNAPVTKTVTSVNAEKRTDAPQIPAQPGPPSNATPSASAKPDQRPALCGTTYYLAPESVLGRETAGFGIDCWALGCIVFQMLTGSSPFKRKTEAESFEATVQRDLRVPADLPEDAIDLIERLLSMEPSERLGNGPDGMAEVMHHPFFEGVDFSQLQRREPPDVLALLRQDRARRVAAVRGEASADEFRDGAPVGSYETACLTLSMEFTPCIGGDFVAAARQETLEGGSKS